jgi:hypothetical protein
MPNGFMPGLGAPGQKEIVRRSERTDPRIILGQAAMWAAIASVVILIIMAAVMLNVRTSWRWIGNNWRWLAIFPVLPWVLGGIMACIILTIELSDPNWPSPRAATGSTRILWPWSKERQPPTAQSTQLIHQHMSLTEFARTLSEFASSFGEDES